MGRQTSRVAAGRAVSLVIEGIKAGLQRDKTVQLVGFGTFKVVERKARTAIHPKTHEPVTIRRVPHRQAGGRQGVEKRSLRKISTRRFPPHPRNPVSRDAKRGFLIVAV